MSKERIKISEDLYDIMPSDYQDLVKSATYGEKLLISTHIEEWRHKIFLQKHVVTRGDDLICESLETRIFCKRDPEDRHGIGGKRVVLRGHATDLTGRSWKSRWAGNQILGRGH